MYFTHVKIKIYILDVMTGSLTKIYINRYCVSELADIVNALKINCQTTSTTMASVFRSSSLQYGENMMSLGFRVSIYDWNGAIDKTTMLRFQHLDYSNGYRWQKGDDVRITQTLLAKFLMRNSFNINGIWSEIIKALRLMRYFDYNLVENQEVGYTFAVVFPSSTIITQPPLLP